MKRLFYISVIFLFGALLGKVAFAEDINPKDLKAMGVLARVKQQNPRMILKEAQEFIDLFCSGGREAEDPPLCSEMYSWKAEALGMTGETRTALMAADKAVDLDDKNPQAYVTRGTAWQKLGREKMAMADFSKVIDLAPQSPEAAVASFNRGLVYGLQGNGVLAEKDFQRAVNLNPHHKDSKKMLDYIRQNNREVLGKCDCLLTGFGPDATPKQRDRTLVDEYAAMKLDELLTKNYGPFSARCSQLIPSSRTVEMMKGSNYSSLARNIARYAATTPKNVLPLNIAVVAVKSPTSNDLALNHRLLTEYGYTEPPNSPLSFGSAMVMLLFSGQILDDLRVIGIEAEFYTPEKQKLIAALAQGQFAVVDKLLQPAVFTDIASRFKMQCAQLAALK